jgi:dihydrofolate reductase
MQIVAARSENNIIGKGIEIPWKVKGEQKLFKEITLGGTLVMGRVTFQSIGRPLPGRTTIIVTRNEEFKVENCHTVHSIDAAITAAKDIGKPIYIVGGGELYRQCLPDADMVHLTTIKTCVDGDIFFPEFPTHDFELVKETLYSSNIDYVYQVFQRIKSPSQSLLD